MKIGLVTHYMPPHWGGVEIVANTLYEGYRAAGHEVRWVASRVPANAPRREDSLVRVQCLNWLEEAFDAPVPLWGLEGAAEIRRLVQWADIIHTQELLFPGTFFSSWWCRHRCPLIISQHNPFIEYPSAWLRGLEHIAIQTLARYNARQATAVVAGTPGGGRLLEELVRPPAGRVQHIPNGIDTKFFSPYEEGEKAALRRAFGIMREAPIVLFVGRIVPRKGATAVYEISTMLPDCEFVMIGRKSPKLVIPDRTSNFRRLADVSYETVRNWYRAADAFLLFSDGDGGFPLVGQEAQATGLPVIARQDQPFVRELAAKKLCIPIPAAPLTAAASAIRSALADQEALRSLAARALEHARQHFSMERMVTDYLALLAACVR